MKNVFKTIVRYCSDRDIHVPQDFIEIFTRMIEDNDEDACDLSDFLRCLDRCVEKWDPREELSNFSYCLQRMAAHVEKHPEKWDQVIQKNLEELIIQIDLIYLSRHLGELVP